MTELVTELRVLDSEQNIFDTDNASVHLQDEAHADAVEVGFQ